MAKGDRPPRDYGKRRSTKEKRRYAEVSAELKARDRSWRLDKGIREREAGIRRKHHGITDESGRLTRDGRTYMKYFRAATRIMAESSRDGMDYLMRLGRLLVEFRTKTQWETKHHWLRRFEQDIDLKPSKADYLRMLWNTYRDDLDKLRHFPRRKLVFIARAKALRSGMDPKDLIARMRSLEPIEVKKLTPEQLVARLKGEEIPEAAKPAKAAPPTLIPVADGCKIMLPPDFKGLTVDWGFPDQEFQRHVGEAVRDRIARLLRDRQDFETIRRKKK